VQPAAAALADLDRALAGLRALPGGPRWTDPSRWHVTVAFLGEVDQPRLDRLATAVAAAAGAGRPVWLRLHGAGTFPPRGLPRVLWAGVAGAPPPGGCPGPGSAAGVAGVPPPGGCPGPDAAAGALPPGGGRPGPGADGAVAQGELAQLRRTAQAVGRAARSAGVPVERKPFRPHLTLGRWRRGDPADREPVDRLTGYAGPAFEVAEIVLMRSHLGPDPRHERLLAWPLPAG
jgi:2'-5' RNA ligase